MKALFYLGLALFAVGVGMAVLGAGDVTNPLGLIDWLFWRGAVVLFLWLFWRLVRAQEGAGGRQR